MNKQKAELSQVLSRVSKYTKNLKQSASMQPITKNQQSSSYSSNSSTNIYEPQISPFNKEKKDNLQTLSVYNQKNHKTRQASRQKNSFNMSSKYPVLKKQFQSQTQKQINIFNKSHSRMEFANSINLFNGPVNSKEIQGKKSGHSHTFTYLNDQDSDKLSQIDSYNIFNNKTSSKFRYSKSPQKDRHYGHNTIYHEQNTKIIPIIQDRKQDRTVSKKIDHEVAKLMLQINRLHQIIQKYRHVIIEIKYKYKQLQQKIEQKILNDHLMDVLKKQIEDLQDRNNALNQVNFSYKQQISQIQHVFIDKISQLRQFYAAKIEQSIKLKKQNSILKEILCIHYEKGLKNETSIKVNENEVIENSYFLSVSKSIDQFNNKWK